MFFTDRIPFIKDLVMRLRSDLRFKVDCGFGVSDEIHSEASYSNMITLISESNILEIVQELNLYLAMSDGIVSDDIVAFDATDVEARDRASVKKENMEKNRKNVVGKRKKSVNNGFWKRRRKKRIFPSMKRPLQPNYLSLCLNFNLRFRFTPNGG